MQAGNGPVHGFVTSGLDAAFDVACRKCGVTPVAAPATTAIAKSRGGPVVDRQGAEAWLKVSGVRVGGDSVMRRRELVAARRPLPFKPRVLHLRDWTADGVVWRAMLSERAPSPMVAWDLRETGRHPVSDAWLAELKAALAAVSQLGAKHWRRSPQLVADWIGEHLGRDLPTDFDVAYTAHGDLTWRNLTAPRLCLLDWENWGLAPAGFDAAFLIVRSLDDPALTRRLLAVFDDVLSTPSGRVGLLTACAERMVDLVPYPEITDLRTAIGELVRHARQAP